MHAVTVVEAQSQLPKLLEQALQGEEVVILCDNAPAVKLVPVTRPGYGICKGQIIMAADFDAPLEDFADYMP
jgi:antitoxin (DNA-binding transcriptional repressor) of toxin-antitoxin stability system